MKGVARTAWRSTVLGAAAVCCVWSAPVCASDSVPRAALRHKAVLIRAARAEMGLEAPCALLAAQIHTESRWREDAVSPVGAQGLAQFMPATSRWLVEVAPHTGKAEPFHPVWSIRAMCAYDHWLFRRTAGAANNCERWAFVLSSYNGGEGWVRKDRRLAERLGYDPSRYFGNTEKVNAGRNAAAIRENRAYPRRIFTVQPLYEKAGFGPALDCGGR